MSRIGKNAVKIPSGVTVELQGNKLKVKGPKGELIKNMNPLMKIEIAGDEIKAVRPDNSKLGKSLHGMTRTMISNMIEGVTKGYIKKLELIGVGYRAQANKNKLNLTLGFSHPIEHVAPQGIEFKMDEEAKNIIIISGIDKEMVGETASKVRSYRKPEPYKGKGVRYQGEYVPKKAGKTAVTTAGGAA